MSLQVSIRKKLRNFHLDIRFCFDSSEGIAGILGSSGCGKSMSLKCIAGIETPDEGNITLNGRVLFDSQKKINIPVQDRNVGYLFQQYALFPHLSVMDNLKLAARKNKNHDEIPDYLNLLKIQDLAAAYPGKLSGGQQQRVALARMLLTRPELLMLDEPFSALDTYLKESIQLDVYEIISGLGKDTLLVSHSRDEIYRFCGGIYILDKGKLAEEGRTKEVFAKPRTLAGARLTGCKNILPVQYRNEHTLYLPDFDTAFSFQESVPADTRYIGFRAHHLLPADKEDGGNILCCGNPKILEDPFELVVVYDHLLWWKAPKNTFAATMPQLPSRFRIPEEQVIFLRE